MNTSSLPIWDVQQRPVALLEFLEPLKKTGAVKSLKVLIPSRKGSTVQGRLCVVRKSNAAIELAHKKIKINASKKCTVLKPETLEYAKYVIVFSTYPESRFSDLEILDWYRCRWQVEIDHYNYIYKIDFCLMISLVTFFCGSCSCIVSKLPHTHITRKY